MLSSGSPSITWASPPPLTYSTCLQSCSPLGLPVSLEHLLHPSPSPCLQSCSRLGLPVSLEHLLHPSPSTCLQSYSPLDLGLWWLTLFSRSCALLSYCIGSIMSCLALLFRCYASLPLKQKRNRNLSDGYMYYNDTYRQTLLRGLVLWFHGTTEISSGSIEL